MDFITQFENTLEHTISQGLLSEANQLIEAYPSTGQPYSVRLLSLLNDLRQRECPFSLPLSEHPHRVILFQTGNYILDYILKQFSAFFVSKGYAVMHFNPADYSSSSEAFFVFARQGVDAAFFFNNVGLLQTFQDGSNLWEALHIPCYDFLVDHPMYYADSLDYAPANTTLLCADRTHADYAIRFYPKLKDAVFMPTGGCEPINTDQERPMDVLFIGSYKFHPETPSDTFAQNITLYLQSHTDQTFEQAVEICAKNSNETDSLTDSELKLLIEKYRFAETSVTALYRKALIQNILDAGITIHVYGNGWEQTGLTGHPNFMLHEPVSFEEGLNLMSQTKILLNHMAWFKEGSSERIFNAMARGAVCVTDSSTFLDDILVHGNNCCIYNLEQVESGTVSHIISALLSNPDQMDIMSTAGQQTAANHTWQKHLLSVTSQTSL